jgi:hypothetical protein
VQLDTVLESGGWPRRLSGLEAAGTRRLGSLRYRSAAILAAGSGIFQMPVL